MRKILLVAILLLLFPLSTIHAAPAAQATVAVTVVPVEDTAYASTALKMIEDARRELILVIYEIRYYDDKRYQNGPTNMLIDALCDAHDRGVDVFVVINLDSWNKANSRDNIAVADRLRSRGLKVYYDSPKQTTHVKLLLADERWTLIGSHNWSYSALAKNHEASVLIDDPAIAKQFAQYARSIVNQ
jgi:phosphatidylserine/phosphatidylglycerophosphate/cardiolipin synthase-like enzyme